MRFLADDDVSAVLTVVGIGAQALLRRDRRVHIDHYLPALRDLRLPNSY
ncbi:MAG TPA: hypothetical protein VMT69_18425 [Kineosporiaceae bacterium]|nr:hypothetical protein [Kineosporiaceae bacterium]